MNMRDIQRRHATVFRIRFGEKLSNRPAKLTDAIRVTSANPDVVDAFVDVYGGERKAWEGQWEAKLPTTALSILVLPGQSISQWWEKYRGSVCDRRCDGMIEQKSGKACMCDPDVEKRTANKDDCAPTTRVSVICPDVAVIGSGMFICHGLIGAETLPQSIAIAEAALSRGLMVPAVLRIVEFKGRTHFIVPQIEVLGISLNELVAAASDGGSGILPHATRDEIGPSFRPVGALPAAPVPPIAQQMAAMDRPYQPAARSNAAEPIRPTGLAPRTAAQVKGGVAVIDVEVSAAAPVVADGGVSGGDASSRPASPPGASPNRVAIAARQAGMDDEGRHDLADWASVGRVRSSTALTDGERVLALDACRKIEAGTHRLKAHDDGTWVLVDSKFGFVAGDPPTGSADPVTVDGVPALSAAEISAMKGPDLVVALRDRGLLVGGKVDEMRARLMDALQVGSESF